MKNNIALVGFMGSGKTTVSRLLAPRLHYKLVSTDDLILAQEKISISDIFQLKGETYFRSLERGIIQKLAGESGLVIDCGGGVVLQRENLQTLQSTGIMVYLKATSDVLYQRTCSSTHRPLLNVADPKSKIQELLAQREPLYEKADYVIDTSHKSIVQVVSEIAVWVHHACRQ